MQVLGRDRLYALENPSYDKIRKVYEANGARTDLLTMGEDGIESGELSRTKASVLHVTPFNSFPSGITASASKRAKYIRWAKARGGYIIEDDFDSEFTLLSKPEDTLFSLAPDGLVIYMNTFSKTIAPSIRAGYLVLPRSCMALYERRQASTPAPSPSMTSSFWRNSSTMATSSAISTASGEEEERNLEIISKALET